MTRVLVLAVILWASSWAGGVPGAESYLSSRRSALSRARSHRATLTASAERAADGVLAGGNLWVGGRQEDFIAKGCGRAGGLAATAPLSGHAPTNHDIVVHALPGKLDQSAQNHL